MKNKWMVTALFDVGSDTFYDATVFIECEGDPKECGIREAVAIINAEYSEEHFSEKDIQDVLVFEQGFIELGFKGAIKKVG